MPEQFGAFQASELYCPKCRSAQPVRERLLLVLPTGELYEYLCSRCATSLGKREITGQRVSAPRPARSRPVAGPAKGPAKGPRGLLR